MGLGGLQRSWRDPTALLRLTARVNPTIPVAMLRIVRAAEGWSDEGWSDIVGLTLAVNLGGLAVNTSHLSRFESQTKYMRTLKLLILPLP